MCLLPIDLCVYIYSILNWWHVWEGYGAFRKWSFAGVKYVTGGGL